MQKYFDASVQVRVETQDGKGNVKFKKIKKNYLVDSLTVTEAEARVVKVFEQMGGVQEFDVLGVTGSRVMDAILIDGDTTEDVSFYEVVSEIKLESSGADDSIKVKKIKETFLVEAKDIYDAKQAVDKLYRKGVGISSDYEIVLIKKSRIVEVISQDTQDLKELPEGKWLTKKVDKDDTEDIQDEDLTEA
jgi:hypothetical protein